MTEVLNFTFFLLPPFIYLSLVVNWFCWLLIMPGKMDSRVKVILQRVPMPCYCAVLGLKPLGVFHFYVLQLSNGLLLQIRIFVLFAEHLARSGGD